MEAINMGPNLYFNILCAMIRSDHVPNPADYRQILWRLHSEQFVVMIPMDENRICDALDFRSTYCFDEDNNAPVSILELMVSLSTRLEAEVMWGTSYRNRTAEWFWDMMSSLGLSEMTDSAYNEAIASRVIRRFLSRTYKRNGQGGLFTVKDKAHDMRQYEIWYQAALHLNEVLRKEGFIES